MSKFLPSMTLRERTAALVLVDVPASFLLLKAPGLLEGNRMVFFVVKDEIFSVTGAARRFRLRVMTDSS